MKRFYKQVSIKQIENEYCIELDNKPVKTQAGKLLQASKDIASLLAWEWEEQVDVINPLVMPVNQFVMTTMDALRPRHELIDHIMSFIDTDLVFYRSDTEPYKTKQAQFWDKWIALAEEKCSITLKTTSRIEALTQDAAFSEYLKNYLEGLDDLSLTVFVSLVDETSSPVLAHAMFEKIARVEEIFEAVFVEDLIRAEIYNEDLYGAAPDQEKKRKSLRLNLEAMEKLIALV